MVISTVLMQRKQQAYSTPNSPLKCNTLWGGGVLPTASGRMTVSASLTAMENRHAQKLPPAGTRRTMPGQHPVVRRPVDPQDCQGAWALSFRCRKAGRGHALVLDFPSPAVPGCERLLADSSRLHFPGRRPFNRPGSCAYRLQIQYDKDCQSLTGGALQEQEAGSSPSPAMRRPFERLFEASRQRRQGCLIPNGKLHRLILPNDACFLFSTRHGRAFARQ